MEMTTEKYCTLPGQQYVRCATLAGGHVCMIGPTPRTIPAMFKAEALAKGAVTEDMLNRIKEGLTTDAIPGIPATLSAAPAPVPGMGADDRFAKIKAALLPILVAGKPEDFTAQGIPQVVAINAACGFDITGAERDAAFAELKASPELAGLTAKA